MSRRRRLVFLGTLPLVALLARGSVADAARKPKPERCPDGRFLVTGDAALVNSGEAASAEEVIVVSGRDVAIEGRCDAKRGVVKATRRGTKVIARWRQCGTARGVRLKGVIASPDCSTIAGKVKAKKQPRAEFSAVRIELEECSGDQCTPADATEPSFDLLVAAAAALAGGADEAALSPDGTSWRYRRTRTGDVVTGEELLHDGTPVLSWTHAGNESDGAADPDRDGAVERRWHLVRNGATSGTLVVTDDADGNGMPERRVTYTLANDNIHVVVEVASDEGVLFPIQQYDADPVQAAAFADGVTNGGADACTPTERQDIEAKFKAAWERGKKCFRDIGLDEQLNFLIWKLGTDGIALTCGELPQDTCAEIDVSDSLFRGALPTAVGVTVDPRFFFGNQICQNNQLNVLWHELLHVVNGPHSPGFTATNDDTYACTALCFNNDPTSNPKATKCQCATCLDTDPCDSRCAGYADCGQDCSLQVVITTAECVPTPCSCGVSNGRIETQRAIGSVRGPVGTVLQVNAPKGLGGKIECSEWSVVPCPRGGASELVCCKRETDGQSETSDYLASFDFPPAFMGIPQCSCGPPTPGHNFVAQAIGVVTGVEDLQTATPCP